MSLNGVSQVSAGPGRKPKFTPEQVEKRTVESAIAVLLEAGITGGLDAVRIDKIVVASEVPRAAAYKVWEAKGQNTPQENLRRATVIEIIRNMPAGNADRTAAYALEMLEANNDRLNSPDTSVRDQLRADMIRDVAGYNHQLLYDQRWRIYKTLTASIGTQDDSELREAVAAGEEALLEAYGALFEQLAELFGLQLRDQFDMQHFTMSVYALNEGLSNRVGPSFNDQKVAIDDTQWSIFAIGFEALLAHYFQPRQ